MSDPRTDPQGDRWHGEAETDEGSFVPRPARRQCPPIPRRRQPPPTHCGASRRNGRDLIIATRPAHQPLPSLHQRQRRRDNFAPRRERFFCLRRPHFFQQRKKWGKERRQKLRFCTSSARYTALVCKAAPPRNRHFLTRCRSADCASTAFRCRCLLLRQKLFVLPCRRLRNNYILCPTGTPTFAALRRQRRDLIIATRPAYQPLPSLLSAAAAQEVQAVPRTDNDTHRTNSARSAPSNSHLSPRARKS